MNRRIVVTGTDTDIGKTVFAQRPGQRGGEDGAGRAG